jgi:hypothetical protein
MATDPQYDMDVVRLPATAGPDDPHVKVYASKNAQTANTLCLLCHGAGAVRAGQWARSLCINDSLDVGSVLPYLRNAYKEGCAAPAVAVAVLTRAQLGRDRAQPELQRR